MTWAVTAAIGGSTALSFFGSQDASRRQSNSANDARQQSDAQFQSTKRDLQPWVTSGGEANARLAALLGIAPKTQSGPNWDQYLKDNPDVAASSVYGNDPAGHYYKYGMKEGRALPQFHDGPSAASTDPNFGSLLKPFSFTGSDLQNEPGYQFGVNQGEQGINRAAAGRGSYDSGATLKALTRFNQDYAGTKYNDAYSRAYNTDNSNKNRTYNYLSGVSGTGVNAAGVTAGLGANAANAGGGYITNAGDAGAAGSVGAANAIGGGVNSYLNYQNNQDVLKYLRGGSFSGGGNRAFSGSM